MPNKILFCGSDKLHIEFDGSRRKNPCSYADLLHRLGVRVVLLLDEAACDTAPFDQRGMRVCGLDALCQFSVSASMDDDSSWRSEQLNNKNAQSPQLTGGALMAFVDLVNAAEGMVAVQCEGRLGQACTLAAAWMAQVDMFPSAEVAAAWVGMARGLDGAAEADMGELRRHWARRRPAPSPLRPARADFFTLGSAQERERLGGVLQRPGGPASPGAGRSSRLSVSPQQRTGREPGLPEQPGPPGRSEKQSCQCRREQQPPCDIRQLRVLSSPPPPPPALEHPLCLAADSIRPRCAPAALLLLLAAIVAPPVPPAAAAAALAVIGFGLAGVLAWMVVLLRPPASVRRRRMPEWAR